MPDEIRSNRVAAVIPVGEFFRRFGSEAACHEHLKNARWGRGLERFVCPDCGHRKGWWLDKRRLVECSDCHHQTSVTAGTVLHRARTPLSKWFWAIYQTAQDKKGISAMELAKQLGVAYQTAWTMLHKLREAMAQRDEAYVLQGLVQVDETYVGGKEPGRSGRGVKTKTPVAVAMELTPAGKPGRVKMSPVKRVNAHCLRGFVKRAVAKGSTLHTDGWSAYISVAKAGYEHRREPTRSGPVAVQKFPWLHTFIGNFKRMLDGTYHSVTRKHLPRYLAEFDYRANRRWQEETLFEHLITATVAGKPMTYRQLVT